MNRPVHMVLETDLYHASGLSRTVRMIFASGYAAMSSSAKAAAGQSVTA